MLLSANILKESTHVKRDNIISLLNEDTSIFSFGLEVLSENNEQIREIMSNIYKDSGYNINESFKEEFSKKFSFSNIIKSIINFFINGIDKIFKQFKILLSKILYDNNTIKKYEKQIRNYNGEIKLNFDYYNYTYLDSNIPTISSFNEFFNNYEEVMEELKNISKNNNFNTIIEKLQKMTENLNSNHREKLNEVRLGVFGKYGKDLRNVSEETYLNRLKEFFRSGYNFPEKEFKLDNKIINETLDRFLKGGSLIKDCENHLKSIEKTSSININRINRMLPEDFLEKYEPINYEFEYALNTYLKAKCGELQQICNIFVMAYSEKLEAVKSAIIQDKKILYEVISTIIKES